MRGIKVILAATLSIGFLYGPTSSAWASRGTGNASCETSNPGSGAIALRGTAAVEVFNPSLGAGGAEVPVDAALRLERGGVVKFFYANFSAFLSVDEQLVCDVLAAVSEGVQTEFGLQGRTLCIVLNKSLSKVDFGDIPIFSTNPTIERALSLADLTVYAVQGTCQ